jgi:molybdopterin molybdotransferase
MGRRTVDGGRRPEVILSRHPSSVPRPPASDPSREIDVDDARERILAAFAPLPMVRLPLAEAMGSVLAVDVIAGSSVPAFANAAMDGFAVRAGDTSGATPDRPARLRVIAEASAGSQSAGMVEPGTAVRIMTGAPVPAGADAVVRFEETDEQSGGSGHRVGDTVEIYHAAPIGEHIRPIGEDVRSGETVLTAGTRVGPAEIGVLATLNRTHATVHRRPRVGVLATGDELVDAGADIGPGQIRNSNAPMLEALVRRCGGEPVTLGIVRDTVDALRERLRQAAGLDLLLTTGGVSVGDYDLVKHVLQREGEIALWQVRIKPGKPLAFGRVGPTPVLGLPGNPVAAAVAFEQFARPAIRKMAGERSLEIPTVMARLSGRIENRGGRRHFVRVAVEATPEGYVARLAGGQGSGVLSTLAKANGLLVIAEDLSSAEDGALLPVQMLDWDLG